MAYSRIRNVSDILSRTSPMGQSWAPLKVFQLRQASKIAAWFPGPPQLQSLRVKMHVAQAAQASGTAELPQLRTKLTAYDATAANRRAQPAVLAGTWPTAVSGGLTPFLKGLSSRAADNKAPNAAAASDPDTIQTIGAPRALHLAAVLAGFSRLNYSTVASESSLAPPAQKADKPFDAGKNADQHGMSTASSFGYTPVSATPLTSAQVGAFSQPASDFPATESKSSPQSGNSLARAIPQPVLHLDGAALGRWAVQHLERALSKPTNGMTGLDPRATVPRGRVSPF